MPLTGNFVITTAVQREFSFADLAVSTDSTAGRLLFDESTRNSIEDDYFASWFYGELLTYQIRGELRRFSLQEIIEDRQVHKLQPEHLNGRFVIFIFDKQAQEWTIITDRVGAMHCYWVRDGERVLAIGSDLAAVARAASKRELDWEAIAGFFSFGFFLDDRTYYKDVRILLPASVYRISAEGQLLEHRRYWEWHHTVDEQRSYDETIDQYHELLGQAVRRCTDDGRSILPLSGGLDSRSLAAMMPQGTQTQAYSYGYSENSIETAIASQIARACGFTYTAHVIQPYLLDRLPEVVAALHGCQDVTQARQVSVSDWLKERADAVLTGLWGDVWCDQMGLADGLPAGKTVLTHTINKLEKRGRGWLLENLVNSHLPNVDINSLLRAQVEAGLAEFEHIADDDFRVKAYKTSRWAFRWSNASLRAFDMGATPRIPYYDVDLIDFFCTVPTAFVRDRRLQIDHLKRYAPQLARIRWQQADANLYLAKYGYWLGLPRRAFHKARRTALKQRPLQRNWEVQFLAPDGRRQLEYWLMAPGQRLHEHVDSAIITRLVADFYEAADGAQGYTISMLLTLAGWLEVIEAT
jgi:asparagine synthase (glutamine-hydrolysing)